MGETGLTIQLTSGEIYVLAALMGHTSVPGVEDETMERWYPRVKYHLKKTMKQLEAKGIVNVGLDGKVKIKASLKRTFDVMCAPEVIGVISNDFKKGKKSKDYVMMAESDRVILKKDAKSLFSISLNKDDEYPALFPQKLFEAKDAGVREKLRYEDLQKAKELAAEFDEDGARELLGSKLSDPDVIEILLGVLGGKGKSFSARIYTRGSGIYRYDRSVLLSLHSDKALKISPDTDGELMFESADMDAVIEEELSCLNR